MDSWETQMLSQEIKVTESQESQMQNKQEHVMQNREATPKSED